MSELYPEIYSKGSSESNTDEYFRKWGWLPTVHRLAKGKPWRYDFVMELPVHEFHVYMAHEMDLQKMKARLRKGDNVTQL